MGQFYIKIELHTVQGFSLPSCFRVLLSEFILLKFHLHPVSLLANKPLAERINQTANFICHLTKVLSFFDVILQCCSIVFGIVLFFMEQHCLEKSF